MQSKHTQELREAGLIKKASDAGVAQINARKQKWGDFAAHVLDASDMSNKPWPVDAHEAVQVVICDAIEEDEGRPLSKRRVPAIQFSRSFQRTSKTGESQAESVSHFEQIPIARINDEGKLEPVNGFNMWDLDLATEILDELREAKQDIEQLPNLSDDLSAITHPHLARLLAKGILPPQENDD